MLKIVNHQKNVNKNHNEISPHTCQMAIIINKNRNKNKTTNGVKDVEKMEPSYSVDGHVNLCSSTVQKSVEVSQ